MDDSIKVTNLKSILITMFLIIFIVSIGTFAWLSYRSNDTAMVLTIGEIDGMSVTLKPYQINSSLNPVTTYDSGIVIDVTANNKKSSEDIFKLFYKIDSIDSELVNSSFKYTVTKSTDNGTTYTEVKTGDFSTASSNSELEIYRESIPGNNTTYLYKVYLWIDGNMGDQSSMQGKVFTGELRASVSFIKTVYTANVVNVGLESEIANSVYIGRQISNAIVQYNSPDEAITALETAYSNNHNGATTPIPFFLKHTVTNGTLWCVRGIDDGDACTTSTGGDCCVYQSETECTSNISTWSSYDGSHSCVKNNFTSSISESYAGFVVTPEMAAAHPSVSFGSGSHAITQSGMTAGTYYLKGGDNGESFLDNAKTIYDAFGDTPDAYCDSDGQTGLQYRNPYKNPPSSQYQCAVNGLNAYVTSYGDVQVDDKSGPSYCRIRWDGHSFCSVGSE